MVETIQGALTRLRALLHWAPDNLVGAIILLLAAIVALLVHSAVGRLLHRVIDARQPYLGRRADRHPESRRSLAFLLIALFVALPVAPFDTGVAVALAHILLVAVIVLIGWIAITASHIVAELYLQRFQIRRPRQPARPQACDAGARLAARGRHAAHHRDDRGGADDVRAGAPIWRQPVRLRRRCRALSPAWRRDRCCRTSSPASSWR